MTQTNQPTETSARNNGKAKLPTHVAKVATAGARRPPTSASGLPGATTTARST